MGIFVASLCFAIILCSATTEAIDGGFTVELIPRSSPKSPLYDPLETPSQRVSNALRSSITRLARFRPNAADVPTVGLTRAQGAYSINITIGTPPVQIAGTADTGSDLIWTQCTPCKQCFKQDAPLFDPSKSSTYADVSCGSNQCKIYYETSCSSQGSTCQYESLYADQSFTNGNLATDMVSLGSTSGKLIQFPEMVFGCGYNNSGIYDSRTSGVVGFGGWDASLVSQIGQSSGGKFSYCLVPRFSESKFSSKLHFGANAEVVGPGVVSTPMIQKSQKTFYYMTLEGISINGKKFEVSGSSGQGADEGNMMIDSGTTFTLLPPDFYNQIEPAVSATIQLPRTEDPNKVLRLCYESSGAFMDDPNITVHFKGADVKLNWYNTFTKVTQNVRCFTFIPSPLQVSIYGNLAQMNFLVGYDIMKRTLSFKPTDCTAD